jgi:predicted nucleic acid-binding Zn ribbon protein
MRVVFNLLTILILTSISSCSGSRTNFNTQKYTSLKKINPQECEQKNECIQFFDDSASMYYSHNNQFSLSEKKSINEFINHSIPVEYPKSSNRQFNLSNHQHQTSTTELKQRTNSKIVPHSQHLSEHSHIKKKPPRKGENRIWFLYTFLFLLGLVLIIFGLFLMFENIFIAGIPFLILGIAACFYPLIHSINNFTKSSDKEKRKRRNLLIFSSIISALLIIYLLLGIF